MRLFSAVFLVLIAGGQLVAEETKSALEQNPEGWTDLLENGLKDWKRVAAPVGSELKEKSPWRLSEDGKTLLCDGEGYREMLLFQREFDDAVLHVEWRFTEPDKKGYNSGVYVRNSADGKIWHQAQVGQNVGHLFGNTLSGGEVTRISTPRPSPGESRARPIGEWNTYEVTAKGKSLTLWINGSVTAQWDACEIPRGHVGVEAEGYQIEFRNIRLKQLP